MIQNLFPNPNILLKNKYIAILRTKYPHKIISFGSACKITYFHTVIGFIIIDITINILILISESTLHSISLITVTAGINLYTETFFLDTCRLAPVHDSGA